MSVFVDIVPDGQEDVRQVSAETGRTTTRLRAEVGQAVKAAAA